MKRTVLVVEDDFDTLHPLAELLRLKEYAVITASDAERALEMARLQQPDLIITDIVLPGKSGLHFISSIRKDARLKAVPIIVISGCGPMILIEAEAAGANFCLEKPISIDYFWAAIDSVFQKVPGSEAAKSPALREVDRAQAGEIDNLVEELRVCTSKDEREALLKKLKERILEFQSKKKTCA